MGSLKCMAILYSTPFSDCPHFIKSLRIIFLTFFLCSAAACAKSVSLPKIGEAFDQSEWNANHPENFNLLGSLGGEKVFQLWAKNPSAIGLAPTADGIVVKDGRVSEVLDGYGLALRERDIALEREHEVVRTYRPPSAYTSAFTPILAPYGESPVIKGFFLGMTMEQAVDNLNKNLNESSNSGSVPRVAADWPGLLQIEYEQIPLNPADKGKGYNMVDKRIMIECLRPARNTNNDWDSYCSTDKFYIVNKFRNPCCPVNFDEKIYYRDIYPSPHNSKTSDAFINLGSKENLHYAGVYLQFDDTGHVQKIRFGAEEFNAAGLSVMELAREVYRAYSIPSEVDFTDRILNPEGPFVFSSDTGWRLTVDEDKPVQGLGFEMALVSSLHAGKKVTLEKVVATPTPSFN